MIKDMQEIVGDHELFRGLSQSHVELLAGCADNIAVQSSEYLFREGEPADHFYLIRHGHVALQMAVPGRGSLVIETLAANDVLGWSWLVPPYRWHFDAEAMAATAAVRFDAACMRGKLNSDHDLGYELTTRFLPLVVDRLQATRLRLLDLYGDVDADA